jgi:hypothetical protein
MSTGIPVINETFENESSFADTTRAVKDERLRNTVVMSVIVEDCF